MTMKKMTWFLGIAILSLLAQPAIAGSLRCGTHVIEGGALDAPTRDEILKKCGEPDDRRGDIWVYQKEGQLTRLLHFNPNGELDRVETE
jgi:hypothetical protein